MRKRNNTANIFSTLEAAFRFLRDDLGKFANDGGNFVVGGGYNFSKHIGLVSEFMWQDLPVNSATKQALNTPGASARQYAWTFNPIIHFPLGHKIGGYLIGGGGWYHRSGETTTPGVGVVCDPIGPGGTDAD